MVRGDEVQPGTFQNSMARPTAELARMMKLVLLSSRYSRITTCVQHEGVSSLHCN